MVLMAIDQGTTSSRCILFDETGALLASAQRTFRQILPKNGWVEHDPEEIWRSVRECVEEAVLRAGVHPSQIAALGIADQRETTVVWDRRTGRPVCNAIVWQCRRTAEAVDRLRAAGLTERIREKTGLIADPYFSATKLQWILENVPGAGDLARAGHLRFGTVDTWLIDRLTGGRVHATDATNASRTMLYNIHTGQWDAELLDLFGVPTSMLPEVRPSWGSFGMAQLLGREIPICGVAGDQQAALFGQGCITAGEGKNTYGTGCFLLLHTGDRPVASKNGLLTTLAASGPDGARYALEGSVFVAGAVVQWLRDGLHLIDSAAETEALARSVPDTDGVYFVPAFTGLGAPHWDAYARGGLFGLTRATTTAHIVRAALESMAFQTADVLEAMEADAGVPLPALRADGGASANGFLMQFQADILGRPVRRPAVLETTALGAAMLAGLGCGLIGSPAEAAALVRAGDTFTPEMAQAERSARLARWQEAVRRTGGWAK